MIIVGLLCFECNKYNVTDRIKNSMFDQRNRIKSRIMACDGVAQLPRHSHNPVLIRLTKGHRNKDYNKTS